MLAINRLYKSFGYKAVQIVGFTFYSMLLIPLLIRFWDIKTYGAWIAIYAMYNLIQTVEFGHNTYAGNAFNSLVNTDVEKAKEVIGSAFRVNILAGLLQMSIILIAYLIGAFKFFIQSDLSEGEIALVLFVLFLYRFLIGSYRGLLIKMLNPFGFIYKSYQFALIERAIEFTILVTAAVTGISLLETAILWFAVKSVFSISVLRFIQKALPEYFPWWQKGSFSIGLVNFKKSFAFISSSFLDRSASEGLVLLISVLLGSTFLPLFIATRTLVNFGGKVTEVFLGPITPELINLYANKQKDNLISIIRSYWFFSGLILTVGFASTVWIVEPIFDFWTSKRLDFRPMLYLGLATILIIQNYGSILYAFLMGINKTKTVFLIALVRAIMLLLGVYFFYRMGIKGILLAIFIAEFFRSFIWLPYYYAKELSIQILNKGPIWLNLLNIGSVILFFYLYFKDYQWYWLTINMVLIVVVFLFYFRHISPQTVQKLRPIIGDFWLKLKKNGA